MDDSSVQKRRKTSSEEEESENGSLSFGKLRIGDSSEEDPAEFKQFALPEIVKQSRQTNSVLTYLDFPHLNPQGIKFPFSVTEGMPGLPFKMEFPASEYLSALVAPYGTPLKFVGPITADERKEKVERYLEKKRTRRLKNVKYTVRQELAGGRKREHGRFVKTERRWKWSSSWESWSTASR